MVESDRRMESAAIRFDGDDGSLDYAKAAGIYTPGIEAPVFPERIVDRVPSDEKSLVLFAFGQSNAANTGEGSYTPRHRAFVFNIFDMQVYRAIDPLPGASNDGGSVWGRLADRLMEAGLYESVVVVPIAVGGSYIRDWAPGGAYSRRLAFGLHRLRMAHVEIDALCWHQGEAEANLTDMDSAEYQRHFHAMLRIVRTAGVKAPIYVAVASLCATADHPLDNRASVRLAQQRLVSIPSRIRPGPDTDLIGMEHRIDGCHFSRSGLERHAEAWFKALTLGAGARWIIWARYRLLGLGQGPSRRRRALVGKKEYYDESS